VEIQRFDNGFFRIIAQYGFMQTPNVPDILAEARRSGIHAPANDTTFYLGRERIIVAGTPGSGRAGTRRAPVGRELRMARWRKKIFVLMARNARSATEFFGIPPNRVVELGAQVEF
jgi:KUP system potassium uptake protein